MNSFDRIFLFAVIYTFVFQVGLATLVCAALRAVWLGAGPWLTGNVLAFFGGMVVPGLAPGPLQMLAFAGLNRGYLLSLAVIVSLGGLVFARLRHTGGPGGWFKPWLVALCAAATGAFLLTFAMANLATDKAAGRERLATYEMGVALVRQGASDPATRIMMQALNRHFPDEAEALIRSMAMTAIAERNAGRPVLFEQGLYGRQVARFVAGQSQSISQAPDQNLLRIARVQSGLFEAYKQDPALCATIVTGARSRLAQMDQAYLADRAEDEIVRAMAEVMTARIEAAAVGTLAPVNRDPEAISAAFADLAQRLDNPLLNGTGLTSDRATCDAGLALFRAIGQLPPHEAGLVMAGLSAPANPT